MKRLLFTLFCLATTASGQRVYICSSVYCDLKGQESIFPNSYSKSKSSSSQFQKVYWECATAMFATSVRNNPDATHLLFSNKSKAPNEYQIVLDQLGVTIVALPFFHQPPDGWYHMYKNSVYTLDIIQYLANNMANDDVGIILDADTVWIKPCDQMVKSIQENYCLRLNIPYEDDYNVNGLNLATARTIYQDLLGGQIEPLKHFVGGELVAATGACMRQIAAQIDPTWDIMLERLKNKRPIFYTEEHFLTFIYYKLGLVAQVGTFMERIGTDEKVIRTVKGNELELTIWHLPAEKPTGFKVLFALAKDPSSVFWKTDLGIPFGYLCAQSCHIIK